MIGPSYKEKKLISEEGEREGKNKKKQTMSLLEWLAGWPPSDLGQSTGYRSASQGWMTTVIKNN